MLKKFIPSQLRLVFKVAKRQWADRVSGLSSQMAKPHYGPFPIFPHRLEVSQPIMPSAFFENKMHNMALAGEAIRKVVLQPDELLSFWAIVGYPGRKQGYKEGRNLVNGKIQGAYGGGLCQVSSILYYLALSCDLEVVERHHHSVDIYAENERFTPLGADATVVFGYKDLRIRNRLRTPIAFDIEVRENHLFARLLSLVPISQMPPVFERSDAPQQRIVRTRAWGKEQALSVYQVLKG